MCFFTIKWFIYVGVFKQQFQNSRDETSQSVYGQNIPLWILNTCCHFDVSKMYVSATILKIINLYFTHGLGSKLKWWGRQVWPLQYCACVQLVTYSEWRVGSTAQKTPIFNVTSTLVFLTVRLSVGDIFSQEYSTRITLIRSA